VKVLRVLVHSFILTLMNLVFVFVGFGIYKIIGAANQIAVQVPLAAVFSILVFLLWFLFVRRHLRETLLPRQSDEFVFVFLIALVWTPVVFVPLHYFTQGYLTSFGNIYWTWIFQIPTNFIALLAARVSVRSGQKAEQ